MSDVNAVTGQARGETTGPGQGKGVGSGQVGQKRPRVTLTRTPQGKCPVSALCLVTLAPSPSAAHSSRLPFSLASSRKPSQILRQNQGPLPGPPRAQPLFCHSQAWSRDLPTHGLPEVGEWALAVPLSLLLAQPSQAGPPPVLTRWTNELFALLFYFWFRPWATRLPGGAGSPC